MSRLLIILPLLLLSSPAWAEEGAETPPPAHERVAVPSPEALRLGDLGRLHDPGEVLELEANGQPFPALFRAEERGEPLGGVILLHDAGGHADWPGVIGPLRRGLPALGWSSLSLQLPIPPIAVAGDIEANARATARLLEASRPRIAAAVELLKSRGVENIALIGHGSGALAAADYLAENLAAGVGGAVLVGVSGVNTPPPLLSPHALRPLSEEEQAAAVEEPPEEEVAAEEPAPEPKPEEAPWQPPRAPAELIELISVPLLDIYGRDDLRPVTTGAAARAAAARRAEQGLPSDAFQRSQRVRVHGKDRAAAVSYRQVAITGADHHFNGHADTLIKRVHGWLKRHLPSR